MFNYIRTALSRYINTIKVCYAIFKAKQEYKNGTMRPSGLPPVDADKLKRSIAEYKSNRVNDQLW